MSDVVSFSPFFAATAAIPRMSNALAMFDPTMLSTTNVVSPAPRAKRDETNSGSEVPIATIVAPIINELIPRSNPIFSLYSVK